MNHPVTHSGDTLLMLGRVEQKAYRIVQFLQIKVHKYERLRTEIEELKRAAEQETLPGNADE